MAQGTKEAFIWITSLLKKYKIPFVISGGFATRIYGSKRKLADIDINIPNKKIYEIFPYVKKYVVCGPKNYKDRNFGILLMTLKYGEQLIDVCGSSNQKNF